MLYQIKSANVIWYIVYLEVRITDHFNEPQMTLHSIDLVPLSLPLVLLEAPHRYMSVDSDPASDLVVTPTEADDTSSVIPVVALGGTFDHLHSGHKILLSTAAWLTKDKLIVGVTDDTLLSSKSNSHVLESLEMRKANVRSFLELFKPGRIEHRIEYDIVTITDPYGPTGWDPNIQALVVSRETISGAEKGAYTYNLFDC